MHALAGTVHVMWWNHESHPWSAELLTLWREAIAEQVKPACNPSMRHRSSSSSSTQHAMRSKKCLGGWYSCGHTHTCSHKKKV